MTRLRAAFDGLQAINLLRIEHTDLLVIAQALNGIDGLEALRRLRWQHHFKRLPLPVMLLLSNASAAERERGRMNWAHAVSLRCLTTRKNC